MMSEYGHRCCGEVKMKLPDLVFNDELYFAEDAIRLFHSPGHTPDSISLLDEKDRVLIVADNIGETMENLVPSLSCEKAIYRRTLENYLALDFHRCVSGHNVVLEKATVKEVLSMLDK
jgi:glyoxylase-like metal-dependent hydrolase (beta-lactamase superfamily II)